MSYFATVRAKTGLLLGGTREHASVRFASRRDAFSWGWTVRDANREAGCDVLPDIDVAESSKPAQIDYFGHCS